MTQNDVDEIVNSVEPDQTAPRTDPDPVGNTIRGKPQFLGPPHNNTGLWYFFSKEQLGKFSFEL